MKPPKGKELSNTNRRAIRDFANLVSDVIIDNLEDADIFNESALGYQENYRAVAAAAEKAVTRALVAILATTVPEAAKGGCPTS